MKYIKILDLENEIYIFDENDNLCEKCSYPLNEQDRCLSCNIFHAKKNKSFTGDIIFFEKVLSVGRYFQKDKSEPPTKQSKDIMTWLIYRYKNEEKWIPYCAELLKMKMQSFLKYSNIPTTNVILCCIPDHETREYKKGDLLIKALSEKMDLISLPLLKKIKDAEKQHSFKGGDILKKKFENVKNAFIINTQFSERIRDKTIFLIDDVVSSMASINECSKLLKEAGAKEVYIFSLGRNILQEKEKKK